MKQKGLTIEPRPGIVYLKFEEAQAGGLDTSSRASAVEYAEVIAVGQDVGVKVGDHVFVKSWGVDSIYHEGKEYRFCNIKTDGILAVVR
jgi:co-chaperonin GroES (HSP10)